jgi:predicted transcriptional regulator
MLAENNLIAYDKISQMFTTTDKGFQFMRRYEDLSKLISAVATKK